MWTCLLLLYAQFAVGIKVDTVIWPQCPTNCSCNNSLDSTVLYIDCHGSLDVDQEQANEIDSMLSNTSGNFEQVNISNRPLMYVPRSVCRLTTLTHLNLDRNRLTRLPENCFAKLSNLRSFSASDNAIETVQDGVFDGLRKLEFLDLSRNRISSIGLSVFATSANLSSLFTILLSENNLTSLEPWLYNRGLIGSFEKKVMIDLSHNKISKFTNQMGLSKMCYNDIPFVYVNLRNNGIKHFMDVMNGWQVDITQLLSCYKVRKRSANVVLSYGESIMCDCDNYQFYSMLSMVDKPFDFEIKILCNLTDPLTRMSSLVDGLYTDLSLFVCELTERCPAGCVCVHRPANATLHIYCSNRNFTVLPLELPDLPDSRTKYKLDFSTTSFFVVWNIMITLSIHSSWMY